jgi:hypothetical protein
VAREFDRIAELRGYPCSIVSDNGTAKLLHEKVTLIAMGGGASVLATPGAPVAAGGLAAGLTGYAVAKGIQGQIILVWFSQEKYFHELDVWLESC